MTPIPRMLFHVAAAWQCRAERKSLKVLGRNARKDKTGFGHKAETPVIAWLAQNDATVGSTCAKREQGCAHEA